MWQAEEGVAIMYRWLTGRRDGTKGFDALPAAVRQRLLAHSRVVLTEIDPHPFGLLVEYVPLRKIAALSMPVTWLLGAEACRGTDGCTHASSRSPLASAPSTSPGLAT